MSKLSIFCLAPTRGRADHVINALKEVNLPGSEISILFHDQKGATGSRSGSSSSPPRNAPAAASSGEIRGVMAWIPGIGHLVIPGIDPLIIAGPITPSLSAASVRSIVDGLVEFGVPDPEAARFEKGITDGAFLIGIHTGNPDERDRAREIFIAAGAEGICSMMEVVTARRPDRRPGGPARPAAA